MGETSDGKEKEQKEVQEIVEKRRVEADEHEKEREKQIEEENVKKFIPRIPFPGRLKKEQEEKKFKRFLDVFKNIQITIPHVEAISEMPIYARFLKEIISKKRKIEREEFIVMNGNCSAVIQKKMLQKMGDPGCYTIPVTIGNTEVGKGLCDLGSSINVMPYPLFLRLKVGKLEPVKMRIQLVDRSLTAPLGIVRDIVVKAGQFLFPADFVILDMEEDLEVPLILGRPFLVTRGALIDAKTDQIKLRVDEEKITSDMKKLMRRVGEDPAEDRLLFPLCST